MALQLHQQQVRAIVCRPSIVSGKVDEMTARVVAVIKTQPSEPQLFEDQRRWCDGTK